MYQTDVRFHFVMADVHPNLVPILCFYFLQYLEMSEWACAAGIMHLCTTASGSRSSGGTAVTSDHDGPPSVSPAEISALAWLAVNSSDVDHRLVGGGRGLSSNSAEKTKHLAVSLWLLSR
jgi:hypothetical protein